MVEETEVRHCVLFSGLNIGLINKDKHVLGYGAQRHKLWLTLKNWSCLAILKWQDKETQCIMSANSEQYSNQRFDSLKNTLTGLLLLGPAGGFLGLTPDGDTILQQLQCPSLLPARRAHLHTWQKNSSNSHSCHHYDTLLLKSNLHNYLHHTGALQHQLHVFIVLHSWKANAPKDSWKTHMMSRKV